MLLLSVFPQRFRATTFAGLLFYPQVSSLCDPLAGQWISRNQMAESVGRVSALDAPTKTTPTEIGFLRCFKDRKAYNPRCGVLPELHGNWGQQGLRDWRRRQPITNCVGWPCILQNRSDVTWILHCVHLVARNRAFPSGGCNAPCVGQYVQRRTKRFAYLFVHLCRPGKYINTYRRSDFGPQLEPTR